MTKTKRQAWTATEFGEWIARNGLRVSDAEEILGLTGSSVRRVKQGVQGVSAQVRKLCEAFETSRVVKDADISMAADILELAALCAEVPFSVVSGTTAASMRGWTSASTHVRFVALPPHPATLSQPDPVIALATETLPERVEIHRDLSGRLFRLADPVRTVTDCIAHDVTVGQFEAEEVIRAALLDGVSVDDLKEFAQKEGCLEKLESYLNRIKS